MSRERELAELARVSAECRQMVKQWAVNPPQPLTATIERNEWPPGPPEPWGDEEWAEHHRLVVERRQAVADAIYAVDYMGTFQQCSQIFHDASALDAYILSCPSPMDVSEALYMWLWYVHTYRSSPLTTIAYNMKLAARRREQT